MASIGAAIQSAGTIVLLLGMLFLISPARCQSEEESKSVRCTWKLNCIPKVMSKAYTINIQESHKPYLLAKYPFDIS